MFELGHRPPLDGLRGCAIVAVLLFHAGLGLPGGFLGVEIFFVISGFMITSVLLEEVRGAGRVSLPMFYARRALRLLPTLIVVLAAVALYAALFPGRPSARGLGRDGVGALFYYANWIFAHTGIAGHLLVHTWSLSVEEQFYLLWPPLLAFLIVRGAGSRVLLTVTLCGIVVSAAERLLWFGHVRPDRLYFGTDTRIDGILIGCALAVIAYAGWLPKSATVTSALRVVAVVGTIGVVVAMLRVERLDAVLYRGGFTAVALASAAVITLVVVAPEGVMARALSTPPLTAIGRMSYGLYLWHLPIFYFVLEADPYAPHALRMTLSIAISLVVATLNHRFVEQPFLALKDRFRPGGGGYFGGMRMPPSRRITSPLR
jgi:peptidoglycan/LPS O-acetylase OafA/YrhL